MKIFFVKITNKSALIELNLVSKYIKYVQISEVRLMVSDLSESTHNLLVENLKASNSYKVTIENIPQSEPILRLWRYTFISNEDLTQIKNFKQTYYGPVNTLRSAVSADRVYEKIITSCND